MSAEIIYGTDFKRSNPKACMIPLSESHPAAALAGTGRIVDCYPEMLPDTAPSEMNMDEGT